MDSMMTPAAEVRVGDMTLLMETALVQVAGTQPTSATGQALDRLAAAFDRVQSAIEEIAVSTAHTIARTAQRAAHPDSVVVEFGLKVSGKGDVIVARAAAEASLKVTLTYQRDPAAGPAPIAGTPAGVPAISTVDAQ